MKYLHPIMTCEESLCYEHDLLGDDVDRTWNAMNDAGRLLGDAVLRDFNELSSFPQNAKVLVLLGKGHNGGDAILAADQILRQFPLAEVTLVYAFGKENLRPLVVRACEDINEVGRVFEQSVADCISSQTKFYDVCIDGLLGMQFKPPFREPLASLVSAVNQMPNIRFRAAVDLPSGVGGISVKEPFRADFTYATGIAKAPVFDPTNARWVGRVRYLNIGFFDNYEMTAGHDSIIMPEVLIPLQKLRPSLSDKRDYGHLFILSGSRQMPGALLMSVKACLYSGVGLVTVFAPESVVATFAAQVPEAMWVPWPESPDGGLALEGKHLLLERLSRADALLMGPGMGREKETQQLLIDCIKEVALPLVLDADALLEESIAALASRSEDWGQALITPHQGEFERISGLLAESCENKILQNFCAKNKLMMLVKGPQTRICDSGQVAVSTFGGPVLSRGGSGDILSGLVAGLLAANSKQGFELLCQAAVLHGMAADLLARDCGQTAVCATDVIGYLSKAIRS